MSHHPLKRDVIFGKPLSARFIPGDVAWRLENRPKELVEVLREHTELLLQQLGSEVVAEHLTDDGEDSVARQLLAKCVDFATIAARLAAYVIRNISHLRCEVICAAVPQITRL